MTPAAVIAHFGTQDRTARALGIQQSSVADWVATGRVPILRQYQIQVITAGALVVETQRQEPANA